VASQNAPSQSASQVSDEFNQAPQRTGWPPQAAAAKNFDDFEDDIPF
jgi:hypothetical protein